MFGFLKNKLKEWVGKAKDTLKPEETEEKIGEKLEEIEKEKIKEKPKKEARQQAKAKKEKTKKLDEKTDELIEKAKENDLETTPLEFNPALNKYEPDLLEIKEKSLEEKEFELIQEGAKEKIEEEIEKDLELKEAELKSSEPAKKQGLISKIFGKKPGAKEAKEKEAVIEPPKKESGEKPAGIWGKIKSSIIYRISGDDFNNLFIDLEMLLLENNVALEVVEDLKNSLSKKLVGREIKKDKLEQEIKVELKNALEELLLNPENPLIKIKEKRKTGEPYIILFFGINGSGKTTNIAKLASLLKKNNLSVVLAAADTFRAASIEQLQEHANRLNVPLIKHDYESDPAAVGFDAIKYAKAHHIDAVLIDTAGRMHTKANLIAEMEKICRVNKPDLKIFVAESIAGNDATEQAKTFNDAIGIDGSILSKADVDEKGGTIISVSHVTKKPILYLGTGQNYDDLRLFNKKEYIGSLGL